MVVPSTNILPLLFYLQPELEKSAADLKVEEISQYITQLDKQISNTWKHSEALIKRNREMSQALFEFGQSLSFLGQSEGDAVGSGLAQVRWIYLFIFCACSF